MHLHLMDITDAEMFNVHKELVQRTLQSFIVAKQEP